MSPDADLEAATRTPAEYLRGLDTFGTLERGKRADLVLLDASPLDELDGQADFGPPFPLGWITDGAVEV